MNKLKVILTAIIIVCVFSACNTQKQQNETTTTTETIKSEETNVRVAVAKSSLEDPTSFLDNVKKYGAEVEDLSASDAYVLVFTKEEHKILIADKTKDVLKSFKSYEDNAEHYIDKIEYDKDFRNMKFFVDKELYDSTASSTSDMIIAASALSYQIYLEGGQNTRVEVIYSGTDEVVSTFSLPMNISYLQ